MSANDYIDSGAIMRARTVRDLGALVRSSRRAQGLTQAELAKRLKVSRDWVVRLEQGHPRLEAQKVLDALAVLGLVLDIDQRGASSGGASPQLDEGQVPPEDPFTSLFGRR